MLHLFKEVEDITKHYVDKFDAASDSSFSALDKDKAKRGGGGSIKTQLRSNLLITDVDSGEVPTSWDVGGIDISNIDKEQRRKSEIKDTNGTVKEILNSIWVPALSVFLSFTVTIGVFPALFVFVESEKQCHDDSSRFYNDLYIPFCSSSSTYSILSAVLALRSLNRCSTRRLYCCSHFYAFSSFHSSCYVIYPTVNYQLL